ncbi:archease [Candidatus Saganbacteria bacterium]|nr:archease [Candidatus Saganbacteria bacterium]
MINKFETIKHPTDIGIIAHGKNIKEVFENAAFAMFSLMTELQAVKTAESFTVKVKGDDREDLFINWLNELNYLEDAKHMLFREFNITRLSDNSLEAVVNGERINKSLHLMHRAIKEATFNGLELTQNKARVVFDV